MSFTACEKLVKAGDPDRHLSAQAAPPEGRAALIAIYAVNLEIARAPWASREPLVAQMRLCWWDDAITDIYRGEVPTSHEILPALREVIFDHNLPQALFATLIKARHFDLYTAPHADREAFDSYIDATSGTVMELATRVLGATPKTLPVIRDFAYGAGVANLLRAVPALKARGCKPLPEPVSDIVNSAMDRLSQARANRSNLPRHLAPALLAGWRADATLAEAKTRPKNIAAGLLEESPARRMASLKWRRLTGRW